MDVKLGRFRSRLVAMIAMPLVLTMTASATSQTFSIERDASATRQRGGAADVALYRAPLPTLVEQRRLAKALAALKPQRPGVVDAYVVVAGLDSDDVFGREATQAALVLERRFDAAGRTVTLTAEPLTDGHERPVASPTTLALVLGRVGELAGPEDAVILYTTSHGSPTAGIAYRDGVRGTGAISPDRLASMLENAGLRNRLVIVSACYSGIFVPRLASPTSVVMSAAAADRSSFGCEPGNDWTFFGDALVNRAMRKNQPLRSVFAEAESSVAGWEAAGQMMGSRPQISFGADVGKWLTPLEKRMPAAVTKPVGRSPAAAVTG